MTAISWKTGTSGTWTAGANWSTGNVPGIGDSVTIGVAGTYTVTVAAATSVSAGTLALSAAGATLDDLGTLSIGSTFALTAGTFILDTGGVLSGGVVAVTTASGFKSNGGTLSGVSYRGTLDLSAAAASISLAGTTGFANAAGTGAGSILLTGVGSKLTRLGSGTLSNATISSGNTTALGADTLSVLDSGSGGILTLGSTLALNFGTGTSALQDSGSSGDGVINVGTISSSGTKGAVLSVSGNSFTNTGVLITGNATTTGTATIADTTASNSGTMTVGAGRLTVNGTSFTNSGLISVATKGRLTIGSNAGTASAASTFSNTGSISDVGGSVTLNGSITSLSNITHSGGTFLIGGYLNDKGGTLAIGTGSALGTITIGNGLDANEQILPGGLITGGTIVDAGGGLVSNYGTLDGVIYDGAISINQAGTNLTIADGITLQGANGTGPGGISIGGTITGTSAQYTNTYLYVYGKTTLDNATITMGSNNTTHTTVKSGVTITTLVNNSSYIVGAESYAASGTLINPSVLTFGANAILTEASIAHYVQVQSQAPDPDNNLNSLDAIINNGQFQLASATGTMDVESTTVTNNALMALSNGGTLEIDTYSQFTNAGTITANGGALLIDINATGPAGTLSSTGTTLVVTTTATNSGTILATGTDVELCGTLTAGFLSHLAATGGQTYLQAYGYAYQSANATLQIGSGASGVANQLVLGGTIIGGAIADSGSGLVAAGGTLDGVTIDGALDPVTKVAASGTYATYIDIADGITLTGANGTGAGTVTLTNGISLLGLGDTTLDNAAISLGAAGGGAVALGENAAYHGTFTLGAGATLTTIGNGATLASGTGAADVFDNAGAIRVESALSITGNEFINGGSLLILGGEVVTSTTSLTLNTGYIDDLGGTLSATSLTNGQGGIIDGTGVLQVSAGGTLVSAGSILATGGTLTIASATSGGYLDAEVGTLVLAGAATGGLLELETAGTIVFDQAASVQDTIDSVVAGDVIDLASTSASAAQIAGGTLAVTLSGGTVLDYALGASVTGQTVAVTSDGQGGSDITFYDLAAASVVPTSFAFSNVHVGDTDSGTLSVTNTDSGQYSEKLDGSVGNPTGAATAGGQFTGLAPGGTDSTDLSVGLSTASAGTLTGAAAVTLSSDGAGVDGNAATVIGTQTIQVSGAVYAYAAPTGVPGTVALGAVRVGGALAGSFTLGDGSVASAYQESLVYGLNGGAGSASGTIASGGSVALGLSLGSSVSGSFSTAETLGLTSTGVGTSGLADTSVGIDTLTVTGQVFQTASAGFGTLVLALGNFHQGDTAGASLGVTNTATGALVDHLLVSGQGASGAFSGGTGSLNLASGAGGSLAIGLSTTGTGSFAGNLTVGLTSHDVTLADLSLGTQTVALSGAVFAYAAPLLSATVLDLGSARVGGSIDGSLTLSNGTTASAYQESLVYGVPGFGAAGTLTAGSSVVTPVSLSSASSGTITTQSQLSFVSTGVGTSNLADTSLGTQTISTTGTFYQTASASLTASSFAFGNVHVGDTASGTLGIANTAAGALVDQLLAGAAESGAGFSGSGSLALAAGGSGGIAVSLNTGATGAYSGSIAVSLASHDGALADLSLGTQTVSLSGAVYAYAAPLVGSTTLDLGAVRTGGSLSGSITLADGSTANAYQESLVYGLSGVGSAGGTIASGGSTSLGVSLGTASSGTVTSSGSLSLVSTGVGTSGLADTALPGDAISVTGTVYQAATAQLATTTLDFGIVHVGDIALESLGVTNGASGALVDQLLASLTGSSGAFSAGGSLALAAGQSGTIGVGLATGSAGVFTGELDLALASHDTALADLLLASDVIDFSGTVDNYAVLAIAASGGPASLSGSGSATTLGFGTVSLGGSGSETISVGNGAAGPADLLSGSITVRGGANFTNTGLGSFSGLGAGQATAQLGVALTATQSGSYSETLVVTGVGSNASGYSGTVGSDTITVTGTVVGSYTLTTGHDTIAAGNGTDTIYAAANTLSSGDSIAAGGGVNTLALTGTGAFDLALPSTLSGIGTVTVGESAAAATTVTLRNNTSAAVDVGSVAGGSITIVGAANSDVIDLGNGTDTVTVGGRSETVNGGSGTDMFEVTARTIAAAIHGGSGTNLLDVTSNGTVAMGGSVTGSFTSVTLLAGGTTFTANAQHGLAIAATTGTDTIRVGDATQSVTGPATVHVLATTATAGVLISNVHAGSTLELVNGGPATLNAGTTGITVMLDKASNLTLSKMGAITAIGSTGADVITAAAQGQTLTGGAGADTLVGYGGFGDIFSDTMAGLGGDRIMNFGGSDTIDITDLHGPTTETFGVSGGYTTVEVTGSSGSVSILLKGTFNAGNLGFNVDGHGGTVISYTGH